MSFQASVIQDSLTPTFRISQCLHILSRYSSDYINYAQTQQNVLKFLSLLMKAFQHPAPTSHLADLTWLRCPDHTGNVFVEPASTSLVTAPPPRPFYSSRTHCHPYSSFQSNLKMYSLLPLSIADSSQVEEQFHLTFNSTIFCLYHIHGS